MTKVATSASDLPAGAKAAAGAPAENEITPEMIEAGERLVRAWLDDTGNRLSVEAGGYGEAGELVTSLFREFRRQR